MVLIASLVVALVVEFGLPVALGIYFRRRFGAPWRIFLYGALVFAVFQLFTRVPAVQVLSGIVQPGQQPEAVQWAWLVGLVITAGLFEEIGRWVGYRWLVQPGRRTWDNALMYGAGHGGIESWVLVGLPVLNTLIAVLMYSGTPASGWNLPPAATAQVQQLLGMAWWVPLLGAFERIGALTLHISLSVLVLQVFIRGQGRWLWMAVGYHALVNFLVVGIAARFWGPVAAEGVMLVVALFSFWVILALRPRAPSPEAKRALVGG